MKNTKARSLIEGLDLLTQSGFANVTVGLLAQRTGMSKSGLFAHFGSKEEVQLNLLEEALRVGAATFVEPALRQPVGLQRLRAIVYGGLAGQIRQGWRGGVRLQRVSLSLMTPRPKIQCGVCVGTVRDLSQSSCLESLSERSE